jgi:NAD(P)-dependent dehydrogenase (short-subunit alcohol dehydrogenase family)
VATTSWDYEGQRVLLTGGTKGIGRILVERFLAAGAQVVTCGRTEPDTLPAAGGRTAAFVPCDVRAIDQLEALAQATVDQLGGIDVLVNNAGGSPHVDAATVSPRFSESIVALNLMAPLHLSQIVNRTMQAQPDGGVIVNIGSVSGVRPSPGTAAYGAAKAGLLSLTRSLAIEWAPKIRVVAVIGGLIETEQAELHYGDAAGIAAVSATVPAGRMGTGDDVADACLFLASPQASYTSGSSIVLDGGGELPSYQGAAGLHDRST